MYCKLNEDISDKSRCTNLIGTFCIVNSQTPSNYLYKCDNLIGTFCIVNVNVNHLCDIGWLI